MTTKDPCREAFIRDYGIEPEKCPPYLFEAYEHSWSACREHCAKIAEEYKNKELILVPTDLIEPFSKAVSEFKSGIAAAIRQEG